MSIAEYEDYDAMGLAELVTNKEVTPSELLEAAIERAERKNPKINAIVHRAYEQARDLAAALGEPRRVQPLFGVPFLLKDILGFCTGLPTTSGSRFVPPMPMPFDSELVVRYKRAGLVPFGKTNAPEFGIVNTTEPLHYGPTRNPWDLGRTPGGSSGGSAAAVAARIVPMAHANDGGGSIRIPAACCGLVGLKPTRGRNPLGPFFGDIMGGLVCEHVVSRSVRDTAAALDATAGPDLGDPYAAPPGPDSYLAEAQQDPGRLRIGVLPEGPDVPIGAEARAALDATMKRLEALGHVVEELAPPSPPPHADAGAQDFVAIWCSGLASGLDGMAQMLGKPPAEDELEPLTWAMYRVGAEVSASAYLRAVGRVQAFGRFYAQYTAKYDVTLSPTLNQPPLLLGTIDVRSEDLAATMQTMTAFTPLTALSNLLGTPAISLPLEWTKEGLPMGMMFSGKLGDEALLLRLAGQLERAEPWAHRRPAGFETRPHVDSKS